MTLVAIATATNRKEFTRWPPDPVVSGSGNREHHHYNECKQKMILPKPVPTPPRLYHNCYVFTRNTLTILTAVLARAILFEVFWLV